MTAAALQSEPSAATVTGAWRLVTWRRLEPGGTEIHPFGEDPLGVLIYAADGTMAVQMLAADRPKIPTEDALGGSESARAQAYSSCLAYFGRYEVQGESILHQVEGSLFPNWSDTVQDRPFVLRDDELSLRVLGPDGQLTNEIVWKRDASSGPPSSVKRSAEEGRASGAKRWESFVGLSASLTGFDPIQLLGTGVAEQYLRTLEAALPAATLTKLLATYRELAQSAEKEQGLSERVLGDAELGPVARNLIVLWYSGSWKRLPDAWRAAYGKRPHDETHVVSPAAYLAGLQWTVVSAHPAGGQQQGFGSWAEPPPGGKR